MLPTTNPTTESAVSVSAVVGICTSVVGLCTLILGVLGSRIAHRQLKISQGQLKISQGQAAAAERKLKMDLFDRRYKIYIATRALLFSIVEHGVLLQNEWVTFNRVTDEHPFLFGPDLSDFLNSITDRARNIIFTTDAAEKSQLTSKLLDEQHQLIARFQPYLNITNVS